MKYLLVISNVFPDTGSESQDLQYSVYIFVGSNFGHRRDTQPKLFKTKFELVHRETGRDRKCYAVIVFYVLTADCKRKWTRNFRGVSSTGHCLPPAAPRQPHGANVIKPTSGVNQIDIHTIYCPHNYIRTFSIVSDSGMNSIRTIFLTKTQNN